ncbi:MAG: O-antigen ligase family protein [Crocinitomicaceae bacterium]|tara:strand:+ start:54310 stop:55563 length:1254 start_codon:yes stop_codon:yes gene_type:complete
MIIKFQNIFKAWNSNDWCLAYILFFSIIYMPLVPIGFAFWILTFWKYFEKKEYKISTGIEIYFLSYYLLLAIGLLWTSDLDTGLFKMENKLTFLLFPILFYFSRFTLSKTKILNILLFSLCFSLILYEVIAIFRSIYHIENNHWGYFKDSLFTLFMHRGYYALYLVIGSLICHSKIYDKKNKAMYIILFIFLSVGVIQTYSKAGVLSLLIFNLILLLFTVGRKKIWKTGLFISFGFISLFIILMSFDSNLINRFKQIPISTSQIKLENNNSSESNQARILMWSASIKSMKKGSILGYGTGDDIAILKEQNESNFNRKMADKEMNSHNQFFTTALQLGIPGLIILLAAFLSSWIKFFREKDILALLISFCFFSNFLIESMLERQAGVVLFCVLTLCLSLNKNHLLIKKNNNTDPMRAS